MLRLALALCLVFAAAPVQAAAYRSGQIEVRGPWSRPAAAGTTGAGFLAIENHGGAAETLTAVTTPIAREVQIHRSSMSGGIMSMSREAQVSAPAHGQVVFAPGGYHLMMLDLDRPLKVGDRFPATLVFASGRRLTVRFEVRTDAPSTAEAR